MTVTLLAGDCLEVMRTLESGCVDAVVTDPPAGIGFMGKEWDGERGGRVQWVAWLVARLSEARRLARPGAVLLCWAIPRTSHWTATAIEDAGWIIEDRIAHLFGTGFPKHQSKLKPACEDWWLARDPGPKWLGVDAGRIGTETTKTNGWRCGGEQVYGGGDGFQAEGFKGTEHAGRWPANVALSHHPECNGHCHADCPVRLLDEQSGESRSCGGQKSLGAFRNGDVYGKGKDIREPGDPGYGDTGGASRFFYVSKASRADRNAGCEPMKGDGGVAAMNSHPT